MDNEVHNIEDLLETLVGLRSDTSIKMMTNDATLMFSIARQVFRGVALTDRQQALAITKLEGYKEQFSELGIDFDFAIDKLRMPLRKIDRSKYIKIVDNLKHVEHGNKWIAIRFPFSKKTIVTLGKIQHNGSEYYHEKGSHEHYFLLNEYNTMQILSLFEDKNFDIDPALIDWYRKLQYMKQNKEQYVPGIYNFKLKNLNKRAVDYMLSSIGEPTPENLSLYKDRSSVLGLEHFDPNKLDDSINMLTTLSQKIVRRTSSNVLVSKKKYTFNNVCETLLELNRFPLLVILPGSDEEVTNGLHDTYNAFRGFIDNSETSVLFRLDGSENKFNSFVKQHKLNSPLDKSLKVVYINSNKVPKPLLKSEWRPLTTLLVGSIQPTNNVRVIMEQTDLIIHYDNEMSQFMRFQKDGIQEI